MPIYEYRCLDCSKVFEKIIWTSKQEEASCPYCKGVNNLRILSAFARGGGSSAKGNPTSATCGPSSGGFS